VLPASSERPPVSWMIPRTIRTQPRVLRLVRTYRWSFLKMFASSSAPMP
jgi:hypothetical protein